MLYSNEKPTVTATDLCVSVRLVALASRRARPLARSASAPPCNAAAEVSVPRAAPVSQPIKKSANATRHATAAALVTRVAAVPMAATVRQTSARARRRAYVNNQFAD